MKTIYAATPWVGLTGSIIVTLGLVAGFVSAPEARFAAFRTQTAPAVVSARFIESIIVTAPKLVADRQAKVARQCATVTC